MRALIIAGIVACVLYIQAVEIEKLTERVVVLEQQNQSFIPKAYAFKECRACHKKGEKL